MQKSGNHHNNWNVYEKANYIWFTRLTGVDEEILNYKRKFLLMFWSQPTHKHHLMMKFCYQITGKTVYVTPITTSLLVTLKERVRCVTYCRNMYYRKGSWRFFFVWVCVSLSRRHIYGRNMWEQLKRIWKDDNIIREILR